MATRLKAHAKDEDKGFWNQVVVITSKDTNLTKSHVRYLESRIIELALKSARVSLANGTNRPRPNLPEADVSDMEYFTGQLQIVLPVLGVNAIRVLPAREQIATRTANESPIFSLALGKRNVNAQAQQIDGEFIMLEGSQVVARWEAIGNVAATRRAYDSYRNQHRSLVEDGSIRVVGDSAVTTRDIVFSSPSSAGAVAVGRSCNGRVAWVAGTMTFGEWEERGVD